MAAPTQMPAISTAPFDHWNPASRPPSEAERARDKLVSLLTSIHPHLLSPACGAGDANDVARELRFILHATRKFVAALYLPAADIGTDYDGDYIKGILGDLAGDLCGSLENAAERSRLWPDDGDDPDPVYRDAAE